MSLQLFREPYTASNKCGHSFEKSFFIEFHTNHATLFAGSTEKQINCPAVSCEEMLLLSDFTDDHLLARKAERVRQKERADNSDDDDEPRGSMHAPQDLASSSDVEESQEERRRKAKKERKQSMAPPSGQGYPDDEDIYDA